LKIDCSAKNIEILDDIISNEIPITKENVKEVFKQIKENPNVDRSNIYFLVKNKISVTKDSIKTFCNMLNKDGFIKDNINNLTQILDETLEQIESFDKSIDVLRDENNGKNVEKSFDGEFENINIENEEPKVQDNLKKSIEIGDNSKEYNIETNVKEVGINKTINESIINENTINETVNNMNTQKKEDVAQDVSTKTQPFVIKEEVSAKKSENKIDDDCNVVLTKDNDDKSNYKINVDYEHDEINDDEESENTKENVFRTNDLKLKKFTSETEKEIKPKIEHIREMVNKLQKKISNTKEFGQEIKIKNIVKELCDLVDEIECSIEEVPENTREVLEKENNSIKQNLKMLVKLNDANCIVHIPLLINKEKTVAELYIFNQKKEKKNKINENNATMFLSLTTKNLGIVEAHIRVVNKTVECDFELDSEVGVDYLTDNKTTLKDMLESYGYNLIRCNVCEHKGKSKNLLDMIEVVQEENRGNFDKKV